MDPHTRLHAQLLQLLHQHCCPVDQRHLVTLAWMVMGLLLSQTVSVNSWRDCIPWGERLAASWQRRCQRWLSHPSLRQHGSDDGGGLQFVSHRRSQLMGKYLGSHVSSARA